MMIYDEDVETLNKVDLMKMNLKFEKRNDVEFSSVYVISQDELWCPIYSSVNYLYRHSLCNDICFFLCHLKLV